MAGNKLTALKVKSLTRPGRYGDGGNLWLQVRRSGAQSWVLRYMVNGRARWLGLGSAELVPLAEARERAIAARRQIEQGIDPIDHRRAARAEAAGLAGMTFEAVARKYIDAHRAGWKSVKHADQWGATLAAYAFPVIGALAVGAVDTGHVTRILEPLWRGKTETASRVRGRIESVLDYASARGWRTGENPARWRGHLDHLLPARAKVRRVEHHPAVPRQRIGAVMARLRESSGVGAAVLKFAILTAARSGEARGAVWSEIDLDAATWTVPAARMKGGRDHRVPLSDAALAVLRAMRPLRDAAHGDLVFPGARRGRPLSDVALAKALAAAGGGDATPHGCRSTFRDWCAEATGYPREVAEAALAHVNRDRVEAAYARTDHFDRRRRLMAEWAAFCARAEPVSAGANVTPMRRAAGDGA